MAVSRRRTIAAFGLFALLICLSCVFAYRKPGNALHAEAKFEHADIGVPGISKMYWANVRNVSLFHVVVMRCDFTDDAFYHGNMLAYAVQRWNTNTQEWTTVVQPTEKTFCKPYPLGIVEAKLHKTVLWPGQQVSTNEEATAGRESFHRGDSLRFAVFTRDLGDYSHAVFTQPFVLDEELTRTDTTFRIAH